MKVEQFFTCHKVSEERKVPLATLSFQGNALSIVAMMMNLLGKRRRIMREYIHVRGS